MGRYPSPRAWVFSRPVHHRGGDQPHRSEWGIAGRQKSFVSALALLTSAAGALFFGRIADRLGCRKIYGYEVLVLAVGAVASAFSTNIWWLLAFRGIPGFGIGGDYPVMSDYASRKNRGRMVSLVFAMQGAGLVIGPLIAIIASPHQGNTTVPARGDRGRGARNRRAAGRPADRDPGCAGRAAHAALVDRRRRRLAVVRFRLLRQHDRERLDHRARGPRMPARLDRPPTHWRF